MHNAAATDLTPTTRPGVETGQRQSVRVAFVVGTFPVVSETFIIQQAADLLDLGVDVQIFAFERGTTENVSSRYTSHRLGERTHYLQPPAAKIHRTLGTVAKLARLLVTAPQRLSAVFDRSLLPDTSFSARVYALAPFAGQKFAVVHCHFGTTAVRYLPLRAALRSTTPLVTTFYGYDASSVLQSQPAGFYARLKLECARFYAMSEDMRARLIAHGFPAEKIRVHPVGVDVEGHPYSARTCRSDEPVQLLAVGRLVEKKGFDDLLDALARVRTQTAQAFNCSIVGSGPLEDALRARVAQLGLGDVVRFVGSVSLERLTEMLPQMHLLVAPSKTAGNGDME